MTTETPKELFEKGFIREDQFRNIDLITSGKILSVYYELQTLLYVGVMLFTTGIGILIYKNIGELGHIFMIISLCILTCICFWYAFRHAVAYSNSVVKSPTHYYDYVVLLGSLLVVSVQGYLQFQFEIFNDTLGLSTLVTSVFFFYVAYRFDHLGILSLAITALAAFWGISVSPKKWYSADFLSGSDFHITAIVFSTALAGIAIFLDRKLVKRHFTFTYLNFCMLIFFSGAVAGLFISEQYGYYLLLIYAGCAFAYYAARLKQSFLFLLYAFLAAYTGTTYFFAMTIFRENYFVWFYYSIISCGGFIYFIIKYRNHFSRKA
jgi:hypothetical protein